MLNTKIYIRQISGLKLSAFPGKPMWAQPLDTLWGTDRANLVCHCVWIAAMALQPILCLGMLHYHRYSELVYCSPESDDHVKSGVLWHTPNEQTYYCKICWFQKHLIHECVPFWYYHSLFSLYILIHIHVGTMEFTYIYNVFLEYNHVSPTNYSLVLACCAMIQNHFQHSNFSPVWSLHTTQIVVILQNNDVHVLIYISLCRPPAPGHRREMELNHCTYTWQHVHITMYKYISKTEWVLPWDVLGYLCCI